MLTILTTTEHREQVETAIRSIDRLEELVTVVTKAKGVADLKTLVISDAAVLPSFDWYDLEPPYVIPKVDLSHEHLLALIFIKLGNHQKAFEYVDEDSEIFNHLLIASHLQFGYEISPEMLEFAKRTSPHNYAVVHYYGNLSQDIRRNEIKQAFQFAIENAENDELRIFSLKHYLNLLLDLEEVDEGIRLIEKHGKLAISEDAKFALNLQLGAFLKEKLELPYDTKELERVLGLQLEAIERLESKGLKTQAGLLLIDAAETANFKEDFIASKELINKSIRYFKEEDIPEFLGEAGLKKAILLYTWSKNGSPQYYKAAINAFQDVLKVFKRDTHPQKFADIHHNLALIYSEIPVGAEEKPMWTAFTASSFKEVLAFYTKEEFPYEYAMACHNYATALMHFPPAKLHDNFEKAADLFREALVVRTADKYPFERALTLLNKLELEWLSHNEGSAKELEQYEAMKTQAEEIKTLVSDPDFVDKADEHLKELEKLRTLIKA